MGTIRNYGKVLLGVATLAAGAGMAQYAQAQNAAKKAADQAAMLHATTTGKATMRYWVNDKSTGKYQEITNPDPTNQCGELDSRDCVIQSENPSLPASLEYSEAVPTATNGIESHPDSSPGFYQ